MKEKNMKQVLAADSGVIETTLKRSLAEATHTVPSDVLAAYEAERLALESSRSYPSYKAAMSAAQAAASARCAGGAGLRVCGTTLAQSSPRLPSTPAASARKCSTRFGLQLVMPMPARSAVSSCTSKSGPVAAADGLGCVDRDELYTGVLQMYCLLPIHLRPPAREAVTEVLLHLARACDAATAPGEEPRGCHGPAATATQEVGHSVCVGGAVARVTGEWAEIVSHIVDA